MNDTAMAPTGMSILKLHFLCSNNDYVMTYRNCLKALIGLYACINSALVGIILKNVK